MSENIQRISRIIKIIANNPGITLSGLLEQLPAHGIHITERTLAKEISKLKHEYHLLPTNDRLRKGYVLEEMTTLSNSEIDLILDALHMLSAKMDDPEAEEVLERLMSLGDRAEGRRTTGLRTRTLRQRNILNKQKDEREKHRLLHHAMREGLEVSFIYHTPRVGKEETVSGYPLFMVFHERGWYCIVRNSTNKSYRPRRVDRIKKCWLTDDSRQNPTRDEDAKEASYLLSCGWGMTFPPTTEELKNSSTNPDIIVRFDRTLAPYILEAVERHPRATVKQVKDGTGSVDFVIRLSDPREFVQWVRSFGSKARILSPQALADKELAELRRMLSSYES